MSGHSSPLTAAEGLWKIEYPQSDRMILASKRLMLKMGPTERKTKRAPTCMGCDKPNPRLRCDRCSDLFCNRDCLTRCVLHELICKPKPAPGEKGAA